MKATHLILVALFIAAFSSVACKKTGPADAVITVIDFTGKRISGATVVLREDSVINPTNNVQASIREVRITDLGGDATFSFKLEAVLKVEVSKGNLTGRDYIRLEQSKSVSKTVLIH